MFGNGKILFPRCVDEACLLSRIYGHKVCLIALVSLSQLNFLLRHIAHGCFKDSLSESPSISILARLQNECPTALKQAAKKTVNGR